MEPKIQPVRLYKAPEVARILGLHVSAVHELIRTGGIRSKRIHPDAHARVPGQAILDFVADEPAAAQKS